MAPGLAWVQADLASLALERQFDVVVMAGNVPLFCPVETRRELVAACAAHVRVGGVLISGFELGRGYELLDYDASCLASGLALLDRWSTWTANRLWTRAATPSGCTRDEVRASRS